MPPNPRSVLILGSGGLRIGQAGEFDYSGSQALKALREASIKTILINPNIATVQTDADMADVVYLQALNLPTVTHIIEKERPDAILLGFGGQTALNLGLLLEETGVLAQYGIQVLGTSIASIRLTEDRELFKQALETLNIKTPKSFSATTVEEALAAAEQIGYPIMLRAAFSLGGLGSGKIENKQLLKQRAQAALNATSQILIEEYLLWKEFEYEIVRDSSGAALTICNMENLDPMGIHTGESIVVAPAQTLNNHEHQTLRNIALRVADHFNIIGECNIQYAVNPDNGDYRVIEMNARLSRSSALASKATGYPLAFVAAKLALGEKLHEIKNSITQKTCAFFEPALDYIVVKIPRWDTQKLKAADRKIGTEMKSVGEVMAIGRSFPEALQKATRMLNIGAHGVTDYPHTIEFPEQEIEHATDRRLFALARFFETGGSIEKAQQLSGIEPWFLQHIFNIAKHTTLLRTQTLTQESLLAAKKMGFSDRTIGTLTQHTESAIRALRQQYDLHPFVKQIDTLAGECAAQTNYLYLTYHAAEHDLTPCSLPPVIVLGSGPYSIGSSVEFDWCAVNTARSLRKLGINTLMINCNPETVSTDYDESDRLYIAELTLETVQDIADFERPYGIIVSVGGQTANNLAPALDAAGYPLLGTPATSIDRAENREKFSALLNELNIEQPEWETVTNLENAKAFATKVGYPLLIRPSYILSGSAMNTVFNDQQLEYYLSAASLVSPEYPVVISKFIQDSKELDIDGVADHGRVVIEAISEHIENAGVHSGDATIVLPPQRLYLETIRQAKKITRKIVQSLNITGPFNIQFIAKNNALSVIECNLRASRSLPFVSKVTNHSFIAIATHVLMGRFQPSTFETLELDYVGVKVPQFSYSRLKGANPVADVEMTSTGEVACLGDNLLEAYFHAWQATEQQIQSKKILVSIGDDKKLHLLMPLLKQLEQQHWDIYATAGTQERLAKNGIGTFFLYKISEPLEPNIQTIITQQQVGLIINLPRNITHDQKTITDGFLIRRLAIDHHVPLITNLQSAQLMLQCLAELYEKPITVKACHTYMHTS